MHRIKMYLQSQKNTLLMNREKKQKKKIQNRKKRRRSDKLLTRGEKKHVINRMRDVIWSLFSCSHTRFQNSPHESTMWH